MNYPLHNPVPAVDLRLEQIILALKSVAADIVVLQEVFHCRHQNRVTETLQHLYPYTAGGGYKPAIRLAPELLVLSKLPLTDIKHVRFRQAPREEWLFTSKGFHHCKVNTPESGEIDLINFHTTAGGMRSHPEHDDMESIRAAQITQILEYAGRLDLVMLAGDLNAGPHSSTTNYEQVLRAGFIDSIHPGLNDIYTWDPENPLVASGTEHYLPAQKIDHILSIKTWAGK